MIGVYIRLAELEKKCMLLYFTKASHIWTVETKANGSKWGYWDSLITIFKYDISCHKKSVN